MHINVSAVKSTCCTVMRTKYGSQHQCNKLGVLRVLVTPPLSVGETEALMGFTSFQPSLEITRLRFRERPYSKRNGWRLMEELA